MMQPYRRASTIISYVIATSLLLLMTSLPTSAASRILMVPGMHYSHVNFFSLYAVGLRDAGHKVDLLVLPEFTKVVTKHEGLRALTISQTDFTTMDKEVSAGTGVDALGKDSFLETMYKIISGSAGYSTKFCSAVMEDSDLQNELSRADYDLVISDGLVFFRCLFIVPYKLGVPYITLTAMLDPWNSGIFSSPAAEPVQMQPLSNDMNFFQRFKNFIASIIIKNIDVFTTDDSLLQKYVPGGGASSFREIYQKSLIWLINFDAWCIDYPRVSAPHYQFIGGVSGQPAAPLTGDIKTFVEGAQHGVIVMSFGSLPFLSNWNKDTSAKFMDAFRRLKQRVVIRYTGEAVEDVPDNVMMTSWLPQNDVLGHNSTRLFITHGGNNGQLEGLYHNVPMLVFPIIGDQKYNALRLERHGYGESLDFKTFTPDQLYNTIQKMLNDQSYVEQIRKCSAIVKSQPSPSEKMNFWVEHVIKFGGDHLRPTTFDLSINQLLLWDVHTVLAVVAFILVYLLYTCTRMCWRKCAKSPNKHKTA